MTPDAIILITGGSVRESPSDGSVRYRPTTYEEADAFGTLGGIARVYGAARLAEQYPNAVVVTTSKEGIDGQSHAQIYADALITEGVEPARIVLEEQSVNTATQVDEAFRLAEMHGWKHLVFITNEYQVPRVRAFAECRTPTPPCTVSYEAAETFFPPDHPLAQGFAAVKKTAAYALRVASEARGIDAIHRGTYQAATQNDKEERK